MLSPNQILGSTWLLYGDLILVEEERRIDLRVHETDLRLLSVKMLDQMLDSVPSLPIAGIPCV